MKNRQKDKILQYMMNYGGITQMDALRDLSCMRLASRIADLRKDGYSIKREMVGSTNRFGEAVSFARYSLEEKA